MMCVIFVFSRYTKMDFDKLIKLHHDFKAHLNFRRVLTQSLEGISNMRSVGNVDIVRIEFDEKI